MADLPRRAEISRAANGRYLEALASTHDRTPHQEAATVCRPVTVAGQRHRVLNPGSKEAGRLLEMVSRGEYAVAGFRNRDGRGHLHPGSSSAAERMPSAIRPRTIAVEVLGHPRRHRDGRRQPHRRRGGENQDAPGRIGLAVTQSLLAGDKATAASFLQQLAADPDAAWLLTFLRALQAIVTGRRDRTLADAPDLNFMMSAEIRFLLETLPKAGK